MPHYRNGDPASIGDLVIGTTYNRQGTVLGVVTKVVPGTDTCNCVIQGIVRKHGNTVVQDQSEDYGELRAFDKVGL